MARRLMTLWWRISEPPGAFYEWLDRTVVPVSGATVRRYDVEGAGGESLSWIESDQRSVEALVTVPASAPAIIERFAFDLVRDAGAVPAQATRWLYLVHTDIPAEIVGDYNAWYDEEHLPRLVTVPGVERARRYVADAGASPRYLTAYDLSIRDAFESPEGLKARKTPWTEKMRSLFQNTRRKMCILAN